MRRGAEELTGTLDRRLPVSEGGGLLRKAFPEHWTFLLGELGVIVKTCGWVEVDQAVWVWGRSRSSPFLNTAPARTRATRWAPVMARQRS